jgi:acyl carrier protein
MTVNDFHKCIASKVRGTWNLHEVALELQLEQDFFTMMSSMSGVIGQPGQANYAAANSFMDAFASYRRSQGLAANAIDLGVVEEYGYVARKEGMGRFFDDRQWHPINEKALHRILETSILQQVSSIVSRNSAPQMLVGLHETLPDDSELRKDRRFAAFFGNNTSTSVKQESSNVSRSAVFARNVQNNTSSTDLVHQCIDLLSEELSKMLQLTDPIMPEKSLTSYGLDSLSSIKLRNWLGAELSVDITTLEIISSQSLYSLCESVVGKLRMENGGRSEEHE